MFEISVRKEGFDRNETICSIYRKYAGLLCIVGFENMVV